MKLKKAFTIKKALRYFDPHKPLSDERWLEAFYVPRIGEHLDEMKRIFLQAPDYPKILFSGPPGCGKSTELAKLKELLFKKFHIIPISAKQMTNNFEVTPEVVVNTILANVGNVAKSKRLRIFEDKIDPLIRRNQGWETVHAEVDTPGKMYDPSFFEKITSGELKIKGPYKKISKTFGRPTANEVIGVINQAVKEIEKRRFLIFKGKKVLLLFSDMDKLEFDSARNLYIKSFLNLTKINCCAVFTFPLSLKYDSDFIRMYRNFSGIYYLENFSLIDGDGDFNEYGREMLQMLIEKRVFGKLFYPGIMDSIIEKSGGILFELINILRECCIIALREKINYIDRATLDEAVERIRLNYKIGLNEDNIRDLLKIRQNKKCPDIGNLTKLLNQYSITEYGTGDDVWYDVNPLLHSILNTMDIEEE